MAEYDSESEFEFEEEDNENPVLSAEMVERFRNIFCKTWKLFAVWYHVIIPTKYAEQVEAVLANYDYTFFPFECCCHVNTGGEKHKHVVVAREVEQGRGVFSERCRKEFGSTDGRRRYYMKRIANAAHLVNIILYIQTANTRGIHTGKRQHCQHYKHSFTDLLFLDNKEKIKARNQLIKSIPEYNLLFTKEAKKYKNKWMNSLKQKKRANF